MSFNLCNLPREQKYQIQLDYEASFWAYQIKRGKKTREQVYDTLHSRPVAEQGVLKQKFEQYLAIMLSQGLPTMLVIKQLESIKTPLVNKFYTLHHVRGRANKQDQVWVAYDNNMIIDKNNRQRLYVYNSLKIIVNMKLLSLIFIYCQYFAIFHWESTMVGCFKEFAECIL